MADANDVYSSRIINKRIEELTDKINNLYKSTYSADSRNLQAFTTISNDIVKSVENILSTNAGIQNMPNIAELYSRLDKKGNTFKHITGDLEDIMQNSDLMNSFMMNPEINRYIKTKDLQVDMILKYFTKLEEALSIKKDMVLCSDSFSDSFLNINNTNIYDMQEKSVFVNNCKRLNQKYKIEEFFEDTYDDTAKYGEKFIYLVPYKKAFEALEKAKAKQNGLILPITGTLESMIILENGVLKNSNNYSSIKLESSYSTSKYINGLNSKINVIFNKTGIISNTLNEIKKAEEIYNKYKGSSLREQFLQEIHIMQEQERKINEGDDLTNKAKSNTGDPIGTDDISIRGKKYRMDKVAPDHLEYDKLYDKANDGLLTNNGDNNRGGKIDEIPGCILRKYERADVIPIYVDEVCLGYYYFDFTYKQNEDIDKSRLILNDTFQNINDEQLQNDQDMVVRLIAKQLSSQIDARFINANQDLKDEIYAILRYNKKFNIEYDTNNINITYIPPQDMYHFYFKLDPILHRGISDLEKSILPALFWVLLSLSTTMGQATRAQDHRVWWVKQNVETNIAKTLMNVINQLKKGNMGIRQMQSLNTILGIVGRYNDYIIPVGPSGEAGITFDTIQGQQIETPTEMLQKYEEQAVNVTDIPLEFVNSTNQIDFATRYTMQSSKVLRKVIKRQNIIQPKFTEIYTRVYNYEYGTDEKYIEVKLPKPMFLYTVNGLALLNNITEYAKAVANIRYPEGMEGIEQEKAEFIKLYSFQMLETYLDTDNIEKLVDEAKSSLIVQEPKEKEEE